MKLLSKKVVSLLMAFAMVIATGTLTAFAASESDTWSIRYTPGAPSSVSNQYDYCEMYSDRDGYVAYASSISNNVQILQGSTSKGTLTSPYVKRYIYEDAGKLGNPTFSFKAVSTLSSCTAKGVIYINN